MARGDDGKPAMAHQPKKKRVDDVQGAPDSPVRTNLMRRRVWRACEQCRRKKIKCDGTEPVCSQCTASGSQCTWVQTKDRAALSRHYVQELEARLLHMESLFSQITPVLNQIGQAAPSSQLPASQTTAVASILQSLADKEKPSHPTDNRSTPESSASIKVEDDVADSLNTLALDEHGHRRWIGGSSTMSLIASFKAATSAPHYRVSPVMEDTNAPNKLYFPASVFFGKVHALPGPEEVEYPPRDLADTLVNAYFSRFHFLCPVVDKPTFMRQYNYLMDRTNDHNLARTETAFIAVVFSVFACAAQLVDDPRLKGEETDDGGMGMIYYERALILHYISHASIQVSHVQCFVLLSSFLCSVNCLPQAWLLIGQAVRIAQDLGMHRSPRRLNIPASEKETRRKIWWGVYILDRMLALALGRPLGVEDCDCDVELPVAIDDEQLGEYFSGAAMTSEAPALMTGFTALCTLYGIAGRVMRQVYAIDNQDNFEQPERRAQLQADVESLDAELTKWLDELPVEFKSNMVNERQVSMGAVLCSHYYSVLTALHRNLLPTSREHVVAPRSAAKAVSSARACIRLAPSFKNVVAPSHHLAFFIQHLFSCAVIVLIYAMHVTDEGAANLALTEAQSCLTALESWEGLWPGARKCKELLAELTNTAREAVASNQQNDQHAHQQQPAAGPPNVPLPRPAPRERRHSFSTTPSVAGKPVRNKLNLRRNLSPDGMGGRSRPSHPPTALRYDSQRARSTSRKRGHDETEEGLAYRLQFSQAFGRPTQSALSSPTSAGSYNSPRMALLEPLPDTRTTPPMLSAPAFSPLSVNGPSPVSPAQGSLASPTQYDFDFSVGQNPFGQSGTAAEGWGYDDSQTMLYGPASASTQGLFEPHPYELAQEPLTIDPASLYTGNGASTGLYGLAPSAAFSTPGLPFQGFDYLRDYDGVNGERGVLQGYDATTFRREPEIPWSLEDMSTDGNGSGR